MNQYVTGAVIKELRENKLLTQAELAAQLHISDKTVSKWENGKGYPDVSLLGPLAGALDVSVTELLSGRAICNANVSSNMLRSKFYVCPVCGNIIHSMGESAISCHGVMLAPAHPEASDERHKIFVESVEDEYFVRIEHDMTKTHYISFLAALSQDRIQLVKLYPEGNAEARFKVNGVRRILYYCNQDGLFYLDVHRAVNGRQAAYDNADKMRAPEHAAGVLIR